MKISFFYKLSLMIFLLITLSFISYFSNKLQHVEHFSLLKNTLNDGGIYTIDALSDLSHRTYIITDYSDLVDKPSENIYIIYINSHKPIENDKNYIEIRNGVKNITITTTIDDTVNKRNQPVITIQNEHPGLIKVGRNCQNITIKNISLIGEGPDGEVVGSPGAPPGALERGAGSLIQKDSFEDSINVEISNCRYIGVVPFDCGGIIGQNCFKKSKNTLIKDCYQEGDVVYDGGGIVGNNFGKEVTGFCKIQNCFKKGNVGYQCGGIVGRNAGSPMTIGENDAHPIDIEDCISESVLAGEYSGGICGPEYSRVIINRCKFKGYISNHEDTFGIGAGGICGGFSKGRSQILNCLAENISGEVSGAKAFGDRGGGICGIETGNAPQTCSEDVEICREKYLVQIENCTAMGVVHLNSTTSEIIYGGGICGAKSGQGKGKVVIKNSCFIGTILDGAGIIGDFAASNGGHVEIHNCFTFSDLGINGYAICGRFNFSTQSKLIIKNCLIKRNGDYEIQNNLNDFNTKKILYPVTNDGTSIFEPQNRELFEAAILGSENNFSVQNKSEFHDKAMTTILKDLGDNDPWIKIKTAPRDTMTFLWSNTYLSLQTGGSYLITKNQELINDNPSGKLNNKRIIILPKRKLTNLNYLDIIHEQTTIEGDAIITKESPIEVDDNWQGLIHLESSSSNHAKNNVHIKNIHIKCLNSMGNTGNLINGNGGICKKNFNNYSSGSEILNCSFVGNITNINYKGLYLVETSGGILGSGSLSNCSNFLVKNCYSEGNIGNHCGGIFGSYSCNGNGSIEECGSNGTIGKFAGGIVGSYSLNAYSTGTYEINIDKCYSSGDIDIFGGGIVGAYCGRHYFDSRTSSITKTMTLNIKRSYSEGIIGENAGGIIGINSLFRLIESCYTLGNIGNNGGGIAMNPIYTLANLVGLNHEKINNLETAIIKNCFSIGNIGSNSGGILGAEGSTQNYEQPIEYKLGLSQTLLDNLKNNFKNSLKIENCLYNYTSSIAVSDASVNKIIGLNSAIKDSSTNNFMFSDLSAFKQMGKFSIKTGISDTWKECNGSHWLLEWQTEDCPNTGAGAGAASEQHSDANLCQSRCNIQRQLIGQHRSLNLLCDCQECCKTSSEEICDDMANYFAQYGCQTNPV